ncbi:MarR family transcriptional regulator [Corynebacterium poyangense]|uniref:MarR family transcriptional regulator n=1 Tax=Corynebacterium poyangense TaxID=2684405 RepID=A0A7H0SNA4_9CORY|nr:MarR family transcriptional regulator [Corynebacterium poyangense]MBZ8177054.1 MarR family transcriptional regulator [Corynebacterium poyangense]QNQ90029.1 MarR family transcriptional regulator [Corynebacterium poyangense]
MTEPRWLNDEEQQLWRLLLSAVRKMTRCMDVTLQEESGISASEFAVLVNLSESGPEGMRLRDLCRGLDWDRSRTSHQITRMERRGLVDKTRCEGDARGVLVTITGDGIRRLEQAAPEHVESVRRLLFDNLSKEQSTVIHQVLVDVLAVKNVPGAEESEIED